MNRHFFAGCLALLLLSACSGVAGYRVRTVEMKGATYLMLKDIAGYYRLDYRVRDKDITLQAKGTVVRLTVDKRAASVNGVIVNLCAAPVVWRAAVIVSEQDFRLVLDPVLRPQSVPRQRVRTIMLDAGHGGKDQGAAVGSLLEKDITLALTRQLSRHLQQLGYKVVTTRATDRALTLEQRTIMLDRANADLFLSLHVNSASDTTVKGIETFVLPPSGTASTYSTSPTKSRKRGNAYDRANLRLAYDLQRHLLRLTRAEDRGVKHANFQVLRDATAPAVLVEIGFLSNATERKRLADPAYRDKLVDGIVSGISAYRRVVESK